MNPQLLLELYNTRPGYFTEDEVDSLEKLAKENNLDFRRNTLDDDFKLGRTISQAVEGVVEGMTTLPVGDDPRNFPERVAKSLGHLVGFVGGPTKFAAGTKALQGVKGLSTFAKAGGSVPMAFTDVLFKGAGNVAKRSELIKSYKFLKEGTKSADILHDALHLGTASAISSWTHGIDEMMSSFMFGSVAGGAFSGIGNYMQLNKMVNSTNPTMAKHGAQGVRALAGGMANHLMTVIPQEDVPPEDQIYSFLLGTYFGYKSMPAHKKMAMRKFGEMREKDLAKPEDLESYKEYPAEVKTEIKSLIEEQQSQLALAAQSFVEEGMMEIPVYGYKGDQYLIVGTPDKRGRVRIQDINDPDAKVKFVKPENLMDLGLATGEVPAETKPTQTETDTGLKPVSTVVAENTESVHMITDLPTRINKVADSLTKEGKYEKEKVATELDKQLKKAGDIEDPNEFVENIRKKFPEAEIKKGSEEYQDLLAFHKRVTTETNVIEYGYDKDTGIFVRGEVDKSNKLIIKKKAPSFLENLFGGMKANLEKVDMFIETTDPKTKKQIRTTYEQDITEVLDYSGENIPSKMIGKKGDKKVKANNDKRRQNGTNYYRLQKELAEQGLYIHGAVKEKGRFVVVPLLVEGKNASGFVANKMMLMNNEFKGTNAQYKAAKIKFSKEMVEFEQMTKKEADVLFDRMVGSNIKVLENINKLDYEVMLKAVREDIAQGRKPRFLLNAQELTQRMQVLDSGDPGLNPILYKDIPDMKDGFRVAIIDTKGKGIDGRKNHFDGIFVLRQDVYDAMTMEGFPTGGGVLKGTVASNATGEGAIIGKFAYFRASNDRNAVMMHNKQHGQMYDTSNKQAGFHKKMGLNVDKLMTTRHSVDGKDVSKFNPLATKNKESKDLITYTLPFEDIRLNLTNYENPRQMLEDTFVVRQIFSNQVEEQISKGTINEFINDHLDRSVKGDKAINKIIDQVISGKQTLTDKQIKKLNVDDLSLQNIVDILSGPDGQLFRKVMSHVQKVENNSEWFNEDLMTPEAINEVSKIQNFHSVGDRLMKLWAHSPATANFKYVSGQMDMLIRKYVLHRILRPKIEGSFKAIGTPYDEYLQIKHQIKYGEYMLHEGAGSKVIKLDAEMQKKLGTKEKELTLRRLWDVYGEKHPDIFEHVIARVPIDSISGIRTLQFKGFTKERGTGVILHPKDMEYLGGMDLDIDSVFIYTKTSKGLRKGLQKNRDEHEVKGKTEEAISKEAKKQYVQESDPESEIFSGINPQDRIQQGVTSEKASKHIGEVVHAKGRVHALFSLLNDKGKTEKRGITRLKIVLDEKTRKGINKRHGISNEEELYLEITPNTDGGKGLRKLSRSLMNIVVDSPKFKNVNLKTGDYQWELVRAAFKDIKIVDSKGRVIRSDILSEGNQALKGIFSGTIYKDLMDVNDALRGYGFGPKGEKITYNLWDPGERNIIKIARRLVDRAEAEGLDIPGSTMVQARRLAELDANFSVTNWINPEKVQKLMDQFKTLSKSGNKALSKILLKQYNMDKRKLEDLPEGTTKEKSEKRDFLMDRLTTLVSIKRLLETSKGLSDKKVFEIVKQANILRNDYALLIARAKEHQIKQQKFVSRKTTINEINTKIIEQSNNMSSAERSFFHEVLLSNIYRHQHSDFQVYRDSLQAQKLAAKKQGDVEKVKEYDFALRNAGDLWNNTSLLSIGLGSRAIPSSTIASWGADLNSLAKKVGDKGNTGTIRQILGLSKSTSKSTAKLREVDKALNQKEANDFIDRLMLAYFKEVPDTARTRKAKESFKEVMRMFPDLTPENFRERFAGVLSQKFIAMNLPAISKTPDAATLGELEFFNRSMLSIKQGNWVDRMLKLKKGDKQGNLVWNKVYTYLFPDTIAEKHLYADLQWMPRKTHVVYKDGLVTKSKEMDVMVPTSHMGHIVKLEDIILQKKEWAEKNSEEIYNDKTKWMAKVDNRLSIEDAVIQLMRLRSTPDIEPGHINIERAAKAQEYLDSLKGKTFSIIEADKVKYVDIEYIQKKMEKSINEITKHVSEEIIHGSEKNRKEFRKFFYEGTKKYRDKHGYFDVERYITNEISNPIWKGKVDLLTGDQHTLQFMQEVVRHITVGNYLYQGTRIMDLAPKQRAQMMRKLLKRIPMKEIGFVEKDYFPGREHLKAEVDAYWNKLALKMADLGMNDKDIALNVLKAKNEFNYRNSEDGGIARDVVDVLMDNVGSTARIKEELKFKQTGQKRMPGSTKGRSKTNPIPGNNNQFEALRNYMLENIKAKYNLMMALSSWRTINHFESTNAMGKQTKNWGRFMRLKTNASLGYPSVIPEKWVNDPTFNIKKTLWYRFSDMAMKKRLDNISTNFFGGKEWFANDNELYQKMAHFANLEAKWSMMTLLASTRTMTNNMLGGSVHSIINAGVRPWMDAGKLEELRARIPLAKGDDPKAIRNWEYFTNMAEAHGATESWLRAELKANPLFRSKQGSRFIKELIENMKKNNWESDKATVMEMAQRHGYSTKVMEAAGWFMKVTEARLRRRSFFAHYLNAMDVLETNKVKFKRDDPWLIRFAMEGVKGTQFIYNNANRPLFSTSNFGRVFSRFQIWTWNSIRFRKDIYKQAKAMGFSPHSKEFDRYKRMVMADMFMFSLASMFPATIFENNMPSPWQQLQDLSAVMFGSEKERERAFFGTLPPSIAWIQAVSPPSARYIMQPIGNMMKGDWSRFASYQVWTWFPFGRLARSVVGPNGVLENPMGAINTLTGLPQFQLSQIVKEKRKEKAEAEEKEATE